MFLTWLHLTRLSNTASYDYTRLGLDVELDLCLQCVSQLCKSEQDQIIPVSWNVWARVRGIKILGALRVQLGCVWNVGIEPLIPF